MFSLLSSYTNNTILALTLVESPPQGLPKTSYYKMVDWWLFFSSNVLVITIGFHTYLAYLASKKNAKARKAAEAAANGVAGGRLEPDNGSIFFRAARFMTPSSRANAVNGGVRK